MTVGPWTPAQGIGMKISISLHKQTTGFGSGRLVYASGGYIGPGMYYLYVCVVIALPPRWPGQPPHCSYYGA